MNAYVPERVFCLWLGGNPMSDARSRQLTLLRERVGVPVELVTEENLDEWILPEHPLHPASNGLTVMHLADYLRAYLVAHHGGGYADIKAPSAGWKQSFDLINSGSVDCVGYPIPDPSNAARFGLPVVVRMSASVRPSTYRHLVYRRLYRHLAGGGAFIMRQGSPIARDYIDGVESVLTRFADHLDSDRVVRSDGSREVGLDVFRGELLGYPLTWGAMCMDVLQPVSLKHRRRVSLTLPQPVWQDKSEYR